MGKFDQDYTRANKTETKTIVTQPRPRLHCKTLACLAKIKKMVLVLLHASLILLKFYIQDKI